MAIFTSLWRSQQHHEIHCEAENQRPAESLLYQEKAQKVQKVWEKAYQQKAYLYLGKADQEKA